ncbi:cytochrome c2 [Gemmobacter tilapiae]|uniref:Cytochrome c2 n=2 Tax=Neogemmobacter tilapiae TaxID=875041 RepID=A0A918WQJ9_9RHOB|nr:cytochrome c2 [Gemmobacter tilapiae]
MMLLRSSVLLALLANPALAGDPAVGEKEFNKCKACHALVAFDGTVVVKGGKTGPNLYGVIGRPVGGMPEYVYGPALLAAGADGQAWDEASLALYVSDPNKWVQEKTGDPGLKTRMTFKLAKGGEDVAAYLATLK